MSRIEKRYDFALFFDVKDGNPNGDPDAGNLPRIDAETGNGIVTDVCLKRKIRNYVQLVQKDESGNPKEGYDIFIKEKAILNSSIEEVYKELGIDATSKKPAKGIDVEKGRARMCRKFFDVRTFGAVLSTGPNAGQVRGPVQLTFGRSVEPIVAIEHSITRVAITKEEDSKKNEMGRKYTVPYGLYCAYGFVSPSFAAQTGFSAEDLAILWEALENMFEYDRSAARGLMSTRRLVIFEHKSALGNKPANELFDRITVKHTGATPGRDFKDYTIYLDGNILDKTVEFVEV